MPSERPSVLIVDDDVEYHSLISGILLNGGFEPQHAVSGADIVERVDTTPPSVILVDLSLASDPEFGCSPTSLLCALRENYREAPIVALSRHRGIAAPELCMVQPITWIAKSAIRDLAPDQLLRTLKSIIEGRAIGDEAQEAPEPGVDPQEPPSSHLCVELNPIDLLLYHEIQSRPELLRTLDWRVFERLLADVLETFGYRVDLMRGTKDGGIDIVAFGHSNAFGQHRYVLQAKRWKNAIGVEPVQRLLFVASHERATKSCLATTSRFTKGAWKIAQEYQWQLSLKDYEGIRQWIAEAAAIKRSGSQVVGSALSCPNA